MALANGGVGELTSLANADSSGGKVKAGREALLANAKLQRRRRPCTAKNNFNYTYTTKTSNSLSLSGRVKNADEEIEMDIGNYARPTKPMHLRVSQAL